MTDNQQNQPVLSAPFSWAGDTDKGRERDENQDAFHVEPELALFLISDGMGGHRGGAIASKIVTEDLPVMVENMLHKLGSQSPRALRRIFKKTIIEQSRQLRLESTSETGYKDMGATLAMALLRQRRAYIANLGDSRIYLLRSGKLRQLTQDHSVISELINSGKIQPHQADNHEAQGQITHYVGMEEKVIPFVRSLALKKSDRLLLCTDGLTDMLDDSVIKQILQQNPDCRTACAALIKQANAAGGHDNITAIVVDWS
jgi:protein phosphatase